MYSSDKYARHKLLGETEIRLGDIDLRQPIRIWMNLRDMDEVRTNFEIVVHSNFDSAMLEEISPQLMTALCQKFAHLSLSIMVFFDEFRLSI